MRANVTTVFMVLGLLVAAAIFIRIGATDVGGALTYAGRLAGMLFLVSAFVALAATVALILTHFAGQDWKYLKAAALLGVLVVLGSTLPFLIFQIEEYTPWVWVCLAFTIWSAWALWELIYHQHAWRDMPRRREFTLAVSLSAIIAAASFGYTYVYQPFSYPITVTTSTKFAKPEAVRDTTYLPVTFRFKNTGKVSAHFLGANYFVLGMDWRSDYTSPQSLPDWERDIEAQSRDLDAFTDDHESFVISSGMITQPADGMWLDPGEEFSHTRVIEVPTGEYRAVEAQAQAVLMRKDRVKFDESSESDYHSWDHSGGDADDLPVWVAKYAGAPKNSEYVRFRLPIIHGNEVLNLTRRSKQLTLWWVLGTNQYPRSSLIGQVGSKSEEKREPDHQELLDHFDRYGFVQSQSGRTEFLLPTAATLRE